MKRLILSLIALIALFGTIAPASAAVTPLDVNSLAAANTELLAVTPLDVNSIAGSTHGPVMERASSAYHCSHAIYSSGSYGSRIYLGGVMSCPTPHSGVFTVGAYARGSSGVGFQNAYNVWSQFNYWGCVPGRVYTFYPFTRVTVNGTQSTYNYGAFNITCRG